MNEMNNFVGMPGAQHMEKQIEKGKKVSQQAAFNSMLEMAQRFKQYEMTIQRMMQIFAEFEDAMNAQRTNFIVFTKMLKDMNVYTDNDWDVAWDKYVVQPQEEGLKKHIEALKAQGGEEEFFGKVIETVKAHEFLPETHNGQVIGSKEIRAFYLQQLLNPVSRQAVLTELQQKIPSLPVYVPPEESEQEVVEEERKMPSCRYCGKDDCPICNPAVF